MTLLKNCGSVLLLSLLSISLKAQTLTQTIRGTVVDKVSKTTLPELRLF